MRRWGDRVGAQTQAIKADYRKSILARELTKKFGRDLLLSMRAPGSFHASRATIMLSSLLLKVLGNVVRDSDKVE